jgi:arylsulfatase A-like enzyme
VDGYNVWPAFVGETISGSDTLARVFHSGFGIFSIRRGPWKLVEGTLGAGSAASAVHPDSINLVGQLYDMRTDPFEKNNLWASEPEKVRELSEILGKIKKNSYHPQ